MHSHLNVNLSRCTVTWTLIYHDAQSPERQFITMHGHLNVNLSRCTVTWTSNKLKHFAYTQQWRKNSYYGQPRRYTEINRSFTFWSFCLHCLTLPHRKTSQRWRFTEQVPQFQKQDSHLSAQAKCYFEAFHIVHCCNQLLILFQPHAHNLLKVKQSRYRPWVAQRVPGT